MLDGELVVLNEHGQPEFGLMQQQRGRYQQGYSVAGEPVLFLVFDLLRLGDTNLIPRYRTLSDRSVPPVPEPPVALEWTDVPSDRTIKPPDIGPIRWWWDQLRRQSE